MPVMYVQRLRAILTEVYKAYFNNGPKYMCDIFKKPKNVYSTRNNMLVQPKCLSFNNGFNFFLDMREPGCGMCWTHVLRR